MPRPLLISIALIASAILPITTVSAQTEVPPAARPTTPDLNQLTVGIGGGIGPTYDGSDSYKFQPGGLVQGKVEGFDFAMRGLNLYVDLIREKPGNAVNISIGPVAQLRLERSGDVKDTRVALLGDRKTAVELGGYVGIAKNGVLNRFDSLGFDISYVHDVTGAHDSYVIQPSVSYSTPLSRRNFALLSVSANYVGAGYGRTYFDVAPVVTAMPTLATYSTNGAGFKNIGANFLLTQSLGANPRKGWSLFALTGYSRLLGQYARSPIVRDAGDRNQFRAIAGVAYSF
jgi:outer membrane scaffolding protein for murein synthesis (MipA/OmpV family)